MANINTDFIDAQINQCYKIISSIGSGRYQDASIRIRNNLNNKNYIWYKPIEQIIDNQISNLFYDIEHNTNLTINFFKNTIDKLQYYKEVAGNEKTY